MDFSHYLIVRREIFTAQDSNKETDNLLWASNSLGGEVGEFENLVKKVYRDHHAQITDEIYDEMISELGDQFWYWVFVFEILGEDPLKILNNYERLDIPEKKYDNLLLISNLMGSKVGKIQNVVDDVFVNQEGSVSNIRKVVLFSALQEFLISWILACRQLEASPFEIISNNIDKLKARYGIK